MEEKFKIEKVEPEPSEISRVLIWKVSEGGEKESLAVLSVIKNSRLVVMETYGELPMQVRREAFCVL